jgi:trehalose 6-phosphate synthase/phosphatase
MPRLIIISNRLPVTVQKKNGAITYTESVGGLTTGLSSLYKQSEGLWIGWPGIAAEELTPLEKAEIQRVLLERHQCFPVFLSYNEVEQYYHGFCNSTIWPLFHYFIDKVDFKSHNWGIYKAVNEKFSDSTELVLKSGDIIWVHDYQLMLLPQMIKESHPDNEVGFFLHIPFPSYEVFRLLTWREELLYGILGADLIGFHTYDYVRHFLSSVRRLLGIEDHFNRLVYEDRYVRVDAFPMGIDYDRFARIDLDSSLDLQPTNLEQRSGVQTILSVDRLDYTKGIPQRIEAFQQFLAQYPEYRGKVRWNIIIAPSRVEIGTYDELRKAVTEAISEVNGQYGTLDWMPIWYFFRSFTQDQLIHFYRNADVMLVTPLRDGMNLVAKEFIASHIDLKGMLVLSETAGAASELSEAVIVNPYDYDAIGAGLKKALEMPQEEQRYRNTILHQRLKRYNVEFWATDFIKELHKSVLETTGTNRQISIEKDSHRLESAYRNADRRILLLDYDGTLVGFHGVPDAAIPDEEIRGLLTELTQDSKNTVIIISGRDRSTLEKWLGDIDGLYLVAGHGLWVYLPEERKWNMTVVSDSSWKDIVRPIIGMYINRMPGALMEEKDFSIALHYRQCESNMATIKIREIKETLMDMTNSSVISIQEGNKVLELKDSRVNKGMAATFFIGRDKYDFCLGVGDDTTDEDLFAAIPEDGFSIKIGLGNTNAAYSLKSWKSMRKLLKRFIEISRETDR